MINRVVKLNNAHSSGFLMVATLGIQYTIQYTLPSPHQHESKSPHGSLSKIFGPCIPLASLALF